MYVPDLFLSYLIINSQAIYPDRNLCLGFSFIFRLCLLFRISGYTAHLHRLIYLSGRSTKVHGSSFANQRAWV